MTVTTYVFDAYGTLFDVHAAVRRHAAEIGPGAERLSELWRAKQLEYTWVRTLAGRYRDFAALTEEALDFATAAIAPDAAALRRRLLDAYRTLDAYPEVPAVLSALKDRGAGVMILSNGTEAMLADAVASAGIGGLVDAVLSVDRIAAYKTHPAAYALLTARPDCDLAALSFQSSNRWDIAGATAQGIRSVWVNRTGRPDEYRDLPPAATIASLAALPGLA